MAESGKHFKVGAVSFLNWRIIFITVQVSEKNSLTKKLDQYNDSNYNFYGKSPPVQILWPFPLNQRPRSIGSPEVHFCSIPALSWIKL